VARSAATWTTPITSGFLTRILVVEKRIFTGTFSIPMAGIRTSVLIAKSTTATIISLKG
jgi:hypothetical protein